MGKLFSRGVFPALVLLLFMGTFSSFIQGQEYPAKPIQLIVAWPPGGSSPIFASLIAEEAKKYLPTPMVVIYKPGAGGTIGAYFVAKSPPDGYTLLMAKPAHIYIVPMLEKVEYSPRDFEIMGQIGSDHLTLAVRADAPWKTLADLIKFAKNNPGAVTCGNSGANTNGHLQAIMFEKAAGIKLTHVPFKGGNDSVTNLAGGHVSMAARWPGDGEALLDSGKVRLLSVFGAQRCKFYPNVPTVIEEGYNLDLGNWTALMAPKGTPKTLLTFWEDILKKLAQDKVFIEKAEKMKMSIEFRSAEDFKKQLQKEIQDVGRTIKDLGLKPM